MKKIYTILVAIMLTATVFAQAPGKMTYQAVVRDGSSTLITSTVVGIEINIYQTTASGSLVYTETQTTTTNVNGLLSIEIGGQTGFDQIDWANGPYFIETNIDVTGGSTYTITGVSQLLTVPYALHAKTAETITGGITENDPIFTSSEAVNITATDITNISNLSNTNTGDQDLSLLATQTALEDTATAIRADFPDVSGFISTEADPVFQAWDKDYADLTNQPTTITTAQASDITANTVKNTYPTADATKLAGIEALAQVNVNTDWDATTGDAEILNKPDLSVYLDNTDDQTLNEVLTQSNNAGATNITNLADPVNAQDAATKVYVDQMMQIMENNGLTVIDFTADNTTTTVSGTVNFTDNSAINPTTWAWDFGDGNSSATQNPAHSYTTAGTYTVSLTASNGTLSKTESKTNYITVSIDGPGAGLTDYDGNTYTSVIIGGQEWMSENLKVTHYPNGDAIPLVTDNTTWGNLADDNTSDAYSYYDNSSANATTYGALYTYAAAIGDNWARDNTANQGVCPDGWHLPTTAEWTTLTDYLGTNAGSKLAGNEPLWTNGDLDQSADFGTSGFSALPSGNRHRNDGSFISLGDIGYWWSATESGSNADYRGLSYNNATVYSNNILKSGGFAVRCVREQVICLFTMGFFCPLYYLIIYLRLAPKKNS